MSAVIDGFALFGLLALLVLIYAATMAWWKLRAANARIASMGRAAERGSAFLHAAGTRTAGEEATPSPYTIPKGPST
jgi:hypothetical protein